MKRLILLNGLILTLTANAYAQSAPLFTTSENIDIANINAAHLVHGDMWWNPTASTPRCEFPKGSGKNVAFNAMLWIAGFNANNQLNAAAVTYRATGSDYWPGPVDTISTTPAQILSNNQNWAKIWKLNRSQLDSFRALTTHTAANTPASILEWPAKGNPYAKGAGGVALSISQDMAPYADVNNDGHYDALTGDYPLMKGDQMLWWVINDAGHPHPVAATTALGIEVRMTAYAYKRNTVVDNVIFYEYLVVSKAISAYHNLRLGFASDVELGDGTDDYVGFDSARRMGIVYNSKSPDRIYGANPPMAGIILLEQPGDALNAYQPAGSFNYYVNNRGLNGDPQDGMEIYRLMQSMNRAGQALPNNAVYAFRESQECDSVNQPDDQRFVISVKDFTLEARGTRKFAFALAAADSSGGCPKMDFSRLHATGDTAYKYYWNPPVPPPIVTTSVNTATAGPLRIYPNPATSLLYVETPAAATGSLRIYDAVGKACDLPSQRNGKTITVATGALPAGVYSIRYQDAAVVKTGIFIKE